MNECGPDGETSSLSVLVVDDNEINRLYIFHALRKMGHRPAMAGDGREALDVFAAQPFDLVLLDVQLPDMDGLQLAQRIRTGQAGTANPTDVPLIALTAFATPDDRSRCLTAGMDAHLAKPLRFGDLAAAITRVMHHQAPAEAPAPAAEAPAFDLSGLTKSSTRAFVVEMLSLFVALAEPKREALRQALSRGDIAAAAPLAHELAGMAGPIRALRLHQAMKTVQEACGSGSLEACRAGHALADRELDAVLTAVRAHPYLADKTH